MGRYAFFNTGLEYKFAYGVQESRDILEFGGTYSKPEHQNHDHAISWSKDDIEPILGILKMLHTHHMIPQFDWTPYPHTLSGTYELKWAFEKHCDERTNSSLHLLALGYVILHQLQYQPELYCEFEV